MKFENKDIKKNIPYAAAGIVVIAAAVLIAVFARGPEKSSDPLPQVQSGTSTTAAVPALDKKVSAKKVSFSTPSIGSLVTGVTVEPGDSATDPKRATYSITFSVNATGSDVYFQPLCQSVAAPETKSGVTFSLIRNGVRADNAVFAKDSCAVLNRGISKQTASGNYLIPKGQQNVFELVVADHPKASGEYKVRLVKAGYSSSDSAAGTFFEVSPFDAERLKTQAASL